MVYELNTITKTMLMQNNLESGSGQKTSGAHSTLWLDTISQPEYETLSNDIETDVLVIGGGISGLTTAYCLVKAGKRVTLIEDGMLFSGETGRTTAHVSNALDDRYSDIIRILGEENAQLAAESHTAAINFIETQVNELQINCDFIRLSGYLFLHPNDEQKTLDDELSATHKVKLETTMQQHAPGIENEEGPFLCFPNQAQFHPLKYLNGLAEFITSHGGTIYTQTHASDIKERQVTANGHRIKANHIVVATNSPVNTTFTYHTKQHPYRSYVIGMLVPKDAYPKALWWDTGDPTSKWVSYPYNYVRLQPYNDTSDVLIVGGQDHKTGQQDDEDITQQERYDHLETWARERFSKATQVVYRWSGQVMEPVDCMAYIGRNPGDEHIYVITGDSGNGMTHGTIGGMLVSDLILGKENPWAKLYDPSRISLKATSDFLKEGGNMAVQYVDLVKKGDIKNPTELPAGEGAVMNVGLHKVAVYKDAGNGVHAYSAICPHLGCVVHWNTDEKTFDCPCHGSRFTAEGVVINGPALSNLEPFQLDKKEK